MATRKGKTIMIIKMDQQLLRRHRPHHKHPVQMCREQMKETITPLIKIDLEIYQLQKQHSRRLKIIQLPTGRLATMLLVSKITIKWKFKILVLCLVTWFLICFFKLSFWNFELIWVFIGRSLGQGTFGKVRLGTHLITGEKVAIKILEKDKIKDQSDVERVTREIHILKIVRHPNVIQLYEVSIFHVYLYTILDHRNVKATFPHNGVCFRWWALWLHCQEETALRRWGLSVHAADYFWRWLHSQSSDLS